MSIYPKEQTVQGSAKGLVHPNRSMDCNVDIHAALPGTVILIHGVNDVGTFFPAAEEGLCAGLNTRLNRQDLTHARYSVPTKADDEKVAPDPDDLFFKRKSDSSTHSPVVPFYWGYRPEGKFNGGGKESGDATAHGQQVDQYGNRLDKDRSKGGGPFANATNSLPDMWNSGKWPGYFNFLDTANADPIRPLLGTPGRMYFVLAAYRLAALVSMIRDFDPKETVSIVAHSQGCLVSLLAQAVLAEKGLRPVDTLIMNNPPYSLVDDFGYVEPLDKKHSGEDAAMKPHYAEIDGVQTLNARLSTLKNIVHKVCDMKQDAPALGEFKGADCMGMVGVRWEASKDRDNRGKVYLYFTPEDMTVGLQNIQGIGWQGVPDMAIGLKIGTKPEEIVDPMGAGTYRTGQTVYSADSYRVPALGELGEGFKQRVFTIKKRRPAPGKPAEAVKVGMPPYKFVMLLDSEDTTGHLASESKWSSRRTNRLSHKALPSSKSEFDTNPDGVRQITGEALPTPVLADLFAGAVNAAGQPDAHGGYDKNDPIDAAIGSSTDRGYEKDAQPRWQVIADPNEASFGGRFSNAFVQKHNDPIDSPAPNVYKGRVMKADGKVDEAQLGLNAGKPEDQQVKVLEAYDCCEEHLFGSPTTTGKLLIKRTETAAEVRLRMQHGASERSFHGAIVGSMQNHRNVTSYDVSLGQGLAATHPEFHAYLCAVADWRLKSVGKGGRGRPSIMTWDKFQADFAKYYSVEPGWRKQLIDGNANYYSNGKLPGCVPTVDKRPPLVVSEIKSVDGNRVPTNPVKKA